MTLPGISSEELKTVLLSIGSHKKNRIGTPIEVATILQKAIEAGASKQGCAEAVHLDDASMISRFLKLLDLAPEIKLLIDWGVSGNTIGFTAAQEIARLNESEQVMLSKKILEERLTKSEVQKIIRIYIKTGQALSQCLEQIIKLRPQVVTRDVFIGAITFVDLKEKLVSLSQEQRNRLMKDVLKKNLPTIQNCGFRLSPERFLLVGGKAVSNELGKIKEDIETYFNNAIKRSLDTYE